MTEDVYAMVEWWMTCLDEADQLTVAQVGDAETVRAIRARSEAERAVFTFHPPSGGDNAFARMMGFKQEPECLGCIDVFPLAGVVGDSLSVPWPCPTLRALVHGHRHDRPGYDEAWMDRSSSVQ